MPEQVLRHFCFWTAQYARAHSLSYLELRHPDGAVFQAEEGSRAGAYLVHVEEGCVYNDDLSC